MEDDKPVLKLPRNPTEFEVQAEAYFRLKAVFPNVRGEISCQFKKAAKWIRRKRGARFDVVVLEKDDTLLCTVEVKDKRETLSHPKKKHYEGLTGVPNVLIAGITQAENSVALVSAALHRHRHPFKN